MNSFKSLVLALATVLALLTHLPSAHAQAIPVQNSSFELPDLGHDTFSAIRFSTVAPAGWSATGSGGTGVGVADPSNSEYAGTNGAVLPGIAAGAQFGYMNLPAAFTNTFTYSGTSLGNFVAGQTYTLTVALGGRHDGGLPVNLFRITLLANGAAVGPGAAAAAVADSFFDVTFTLTATGLQAGQAIGIMFTATNTSAFFEQANFDNVRLTTVAATPESGATALLLGMALFGTCLSRHFLRRREHT